MKETFSAGAASFPVIKFVFNRRKTASDDRPGSVELEALLSGKRRWWSSGVRILEGQWRDGQVVNRGDAPDLNLRLEAFARPARELIRARMVEGASVSLAEIARVMSRGDIGKNDFFDFVEDEIKTRGDIEESTRRAHGKLLTAMSESGLLLSRSDLRPETVRAFDKWLHNRGICQASVHGYHKLLKTYLNRARAVGWEIDDLYKGFKIDRGRSAVRRFLSDEELQKVRKVQIPAVLEKVRDMFLFQAGTGLAYSDMVKFDVSNVKRQGDMYIYTEHRHKTGVPFYVVLLPEVVAILDRYDWKLPTMTLEQYNARLKLIAEACGIGRLTSHMARHTFAVRGINHGIPIEVLARILGHTDIKTTQIYAKVANQTVEAAFAQLGLCKK